MKLPRRQFLHLAASAAALPVLSRIARAQPYPSRRRRARRMSLVGTKRPFYACRRMSVLGGKAGVQRTSSKDRYWPWADVARCA